MKYPYDARYFPPFPVLQVSLVNSDEGLRTAPTLGLLDSGSDGTLAPIALLEQIAAVSLEDRRIRSHWGEWRNVPLFVVDIELDNFRLPGVFVVGDEQGSEVVLGRNVLNRLRLLLDGPANVAENLTR